MQALHNRSFGAEPEKNNTADTSVMAATTWPQGVSSAP
jgi:hypothetical protein